MNAIFSVAYTGHTGMGLAMLVFFHGTIAGADIAGASYDGTYHFTDEGNLEGEVRITIPGGVPLVTGVPAATEPYTVDFGLHLPADMGGEKPVQLNLPFGKVNAIFRKIRNLQFTAEGAETLDDLAPCAPS